MVNLLKPSQKLPSSFSTLVDLLQHRSIHQPDQIGYIFLQDGETEAISINYQELERQARSIAAQLQGMNLREERVLLLYLPGLDFIAAFFGCLYAGVVAVPVYPPQGYQNLARLQAIAVDAQATTILTTTSLLAEVRKYFSQYPKLDNLSCIATDNLNSDLVSDWQKPSLSRNSLAFLQYTSGSTGSPKGVMVSYDNIFHNSVLIHQGFEHHANSQGVIWLPPYHDMGLIGGILQPLYGGFPVTLMSPTSFLRKPIRWLQAISRYRATTSGGPNFAYRLCLQKITPQQKATLDLSSWEVAFTGAEPICPQTLEQFTEAFAPCGFRREAFYPCYGLAEATLFVCGGVKTESSLIQKVESQALEQNRVVVATDESQRTQKIVSCGQPRLEVIIVNPEFLSPCQAKQVGEIWVSGSSVAQGYWNQSEQTQESFSAYLATGEGPFLRTGDLGFLQNGELFVTGRIKDIIIIRGHNYYPQDIERTTEQSHPTLRQGGCAAFSIDREGEQLVVVVEVKRESLRNLDSERVIEAIRSAISQEHGLQTYAVLLLKQGSIPKTSSGKIQRYACKRGYLENCLEAVEKSEVGSQATAAGVATTGGTPATRSLVLGSQRHLYNGGNPNASCSWGKPPRPHSLRNTVTPQVEQVARKSELKKNSESQASSFQEERIPPRSNHADQLIQWLRNYANEQINSRLIDERRCITPSVVLDFGNKGLLGMQVPPEYGGLGLDNTDTMRVLEQLGALDPTLSLFVGLNNILGIRPILNYGSQTVKDELLPILATGRELAAFALTEAVAGSNPQAIASTATPHPQGYWLLNGTKIWSGSAAWAGVINVFVQHQDSEGKFRGISGFAVRKGTKGLRQGPEALTMGMRGMVQNTVYLNDVTVSATQLLGEPGAGMKVAQDAMMYGRLAIAAASVGGMKRCAQLMLRYSSRRSISTGRLLDNPVVLTRLNSLTAAITAVEVLVTSLAQLLDRGQVVPVEAYTVCKTAAPEFYWQAADDLVQFLGGRGYLETNIAPQILRDARVLRIFEGPTETLTMFLGARVINQSEDLQQFLCQTLGTPEVYQRLIAAAQQIGDRCISSHSPFSERVTAQRWAAILTGEIATFAILLAVLQARAAQSNSELIHRAIAWTQEHFDQKLAQALSKTPDELVISSAEVTAALITDYETTIGDLEQTLAGEDYELDELLRKSPVWEQRSRGAEEQRSRGAEGQRGRGAEGQRSRGAEGQRGRGDRDKGDGEDGETGRLGEFIDSPFSIPQSKTDAIQDWLVEWLGKKLKIPTQSIDPSKSFADYGIDSVIAVELAQDLQEWLDYPQELEATIAWNFPTLESLAQYLTTLLETAQTSPQPDLVRQSSKIEPEIVSQIQEFSEDQIQASIAQEMVELEHLLQGR